MPDHAVLIYLPSLQDPTRGLNEIEDALAGAIEEANAGEFDGNEIGPEGAVLFTYGADADALWAAVEPILQTANLGAGSYVIKRYGDPGDREVRIDL